MPPPSQTISINDFRPGIVTNFGYGNITPGTLDLPVGSAQEGTVRCFADRTGSLSPLPGRHTSLDQTFPASSHMNQTSQMVATGMFTLGPLARFHTFSPFFAQDEDFADELHFMFEGPVAGSLYHGLEWHIRKLYVPVLPPDIVTNLDGTTQENQSGVRGITGIIPRALNAGPYTNPGLTTFVTEWSESPFYSLAAHFIKAYPNPAALTTDVPGNFTSGLANVQLVAHAGRVLFLQTVPHSHGADSGIFYSNEDILYTDPPNSAVLTSNAPTVLDEDNAVGYGSWGSLAYGELILIKQYDGAVVIDGDAFAPSVSILRGVQGTGNLMNQASVCPSGLVYCVENDGAYLWTGGSTSQKISTINDRFYDRAGGNPLTGIKVKHTSYGRFVVFPNLWTYDSLTQSWWQMDADSSFDVGLVESGKGNPNLLYAAQDTVILPAHFGVRVYDSNMPASSYVWIGQPLKVADTRIDVTGITISLSNVTAASTVVVEMVGVVGSAPATFTITAPTTGPIRLNIPNPAMQNLYDIQPKITVSAASPAAAPTLNSISFEYGPATPYSQNA